MARTTKQLSGGGKDKFLRTLVGAEAALAPEIAERLGDQLCDAIADIRVRRDVWQSQLSGNDAVAPAAAAVSSAALARQSASIAPKAEPFDPFVFSALAVLTKQGALALATKLDGITQPDHLHALARAQHLAVDTSVKDLPTLRAAILVATESRLAERRAAAS